MKTNTLMEYTAPELEVISTVVEKGFEASFADAGIDFADETDYGNF